MSYIDLPRRPTWKECEINLEIDPGRFATNRYPQMGGYGSVAVVEPYENCFDMWIWHDGDFPLADTASAPPMYFHFCSAEQFRIFADEIEMLQRKALK